MRVDLSHASLLTFDAQVLSDGVRPASSPADDVAQRSKGACDALSPVTTLVLAYNALRQLKGVTALHCLAVLDVSHNNLTILQSNDLPVSLTVLNVSHNKLRQVHHLTTALPQLVTLDASHNTLRAEGVASLPPSLRSLDLSYNELTTLDFASSLQCLTSLDVANNRIRRMHDVRAISHISSLRRLDIRHNPLLCEGREASREQILAVAPHLSQLNGIAVSSATARDAHSLLMQSPAKSFVCDSTLPTSSSLLTTPTHGSRGEVVSRSRHLPFAHVAPCNAADKASRLMHVKLDELQRLVQASQRAEAELRAQHVLLVRQVKQCDETSSAEAREAAALRREIDDLTTEENELRGVARRAEQTFEQTHASLNASKYGTSSPCSRERQASA